MKPKTKDGGGKADKEAQEQLRAAHEAARAHLIRFPDEKANVRAIAVFLDILEPRYVLPGRQMVVRGKHIEALKLAGIPFEDLSEPPKRNGKKKAGKTTPVPPERT
jgi:hypothetical protein